MTPGSNEGGMAAPLADSVADGVQSRNPFSSAVLPGRGYELGHGAVVIAAITSCTNTSNPQVLMAAGLLARNAVQTRPQRQAMGQDQPGARLPGGHGVPGRSRPDCSTWSSWASTSSATAARPASATRARCRRMSRRPSRWATSSSRRCSPATATSRAASSRRSAQTTSPRRRWSWPTRWPARWTSTSRRSRWAQTSDGAAGLPARHLARTHGGRRGDAQRRPVGDVPQQVRRRLQPATTRGATSRCPTGDLFDWDPFSTYVRKPPYFDGMTLEIDDPQDIRGARALGVFGDSVTTDHISPAGEIVRQSPAGHYLTENDVPVAEYNTFGARRGNHEVMGRGTFGNIRLRNRLVPGVEGWFTQHLPDGEEMSIWDASAEVPGRRRATDHPRRQGVRHRLVSRLGGEGPANPRRQGRHRRELRAHPSQQPNRHGHPAAAVRGRRSRSGAWD